MPRKQEFIIYKLFADGVETEYVGTSTIGEKGIKQTISNNFNTISLYPTETKPWYQIFRTEGKGNNEVKWQILETVENKEQLKERKKYWQDQIYGKGQPLPPKVCEAPENPPTEEVKENPLSTKSAVKLLREYYADKYTRKSKSKVKEYVDTHLVKKESDSYKSQKQQNQLRNYLSGNIIQNDLIPPSVVVKSNVEQVLNEIDSMTESMSESEIENLKEKHNKEKEALENRIHNQQVIMSDMNTKYKLLEQRYKDLVITLYETGHLNLS